MNFPGTQSSANWTWRSGKEALDPALAKKLYRLTKLYHRLGNQE